LRRQTSSTLFPYPTLFRTDIKDFLGEGWEQTIERIRKNIPESLMQRMRPRANAEAYYKRKTEILRQYQRPENDLKLLKLTWTVEDRKSTRLNSSHVKISYA